MMGATCLNAWRPGVWYVIVLICSSKMLRCDFFEPFDNSSGSRCSAAAQYIGEPPTASTPSLNPLRL